MAREQERVDLEGHSAPETSELPSTSRSISREEPNTDSSSEDCEGDNEMKLQLEGYHKRYHISMGDEAEPDSENDAENSSIKRGYQHSCVYCRKSLLGLSELPAPPSYPTIVPVPSVFTSNPSSYSSPSEEDNDDESWNNYYPDMVLQEELGYSREVEQAIQENYSISPMLSHDSLIVLESASGSHSNEDD